MPRKAPDVSIGSPRKRKEVDPGAAEAFEARVANEEGRAPLQVVAAAEIEPAEKIDSEVGEPRQGQGPTNRKGTVDTPYVRKSDGVATVALTFTVPVDLARQVKVHAAMTGRKISDVGTEALVRYLQAQE